MRTEGTFEWFVSRQAALPQAALPAAVFFQRLETGLFFSSNVWNARTVSQGALLHAGRGARVGRKTLAGLAAAQRAAGFEEVALVDVEGAIAILVRSHDGPFRR